MKDERLWDMRLKAERDLRISGTALRLILRIISDRAICKDAFADEPFPLPWSKVALWCGRAKDQCYAALAMLENSGYLKKTAAKGSPPICQFSLLLKLRENPPIKSRKKPEINWRKNPPNLISTSFQEEKDPKGRNSSLRSKVTTKGETIARSARKLTDKERERYAKELRQWRAAT